MSLTDSDVGSRPRLLVVGHSASRSGSPKVLLQVLRWLAENTDFDIDLALAAGGPLVGDFRRYVSNVKVMSDRRASFLLRIALFIARKLHAARVEARLVIRIANTVTVSTRAYDLVYLNSVSSLRSIQHATRTCPLVLHVHELEFAVASSLPGHAEALIHVADHYIAVSGPVQRMLIEQFGTPPTAVDLITGFLPDDEAACNARLPAEARAELGLDPGTPMVLGCGTVEWRKGIDIFIATAAALARQPSAPPIRWYWVGGGDEVLRRGAQLEITKAGLDGVVTLVPEQADPSVFYEASDLLFLSSREDPYPLVVLEAALRERPVVCQENSGGAVDFVARGAGLVVRYLDIDALGDAVLTILSDAALASAMGRLGRRIVLEEHLASQVCPAIGEVLLRAVPTNNGSGYSIRPAPPPRAESKIAPFT